MTSGASPSPAELAFPGDGEMARRMRAYPWPSSPLGDPRDWPASLRTACRICLTSRFPMIVWWGEELRFSRIEAGRMQASFEPLDLGAFTTALASVFQSAIERAGIRYEVDCPPLSAPVYIDREMWEKVVFNLLSNALKFTFGGTLSVSLREEDGQAALRVADTGVGIAAAEIPRLFDRFHRIENTPSRSNEGSGIGLALVRELVGLHGGTITAESSENVGTTFTVRLPFGHGHLPEANVVAASGPHAGPAVANAFLAEAMRWLPSDQIAQEAAPTAPVAGLARRDADGKPALARVLLADDNADMPVLLLSARAGQEAAIEGLEAGADDYLVKPFSAAELLARVRANVELARVRSHHARWRAALLDSLYEAFFRGPGQLRRVARPGVHDARCRPAGRHRAVLEVRRQGPRPGPAGRGPRGRTDGGGKGHRLRRLSRVPAFCRLGDRWLCGLHAVACERGNESDLWCDR